MSDLDTSKFQTVWTESFNNGPGILSNAYGPGLDLSVAGQVTLHQDAANNYDSGIMVPAAGASSGDGFGLYSFTMQLDNSAPGTFACLWPSSDQWPGPELDVVEVDFNGNGYSTIHWKGADGSNQYESHALSGIDITKVHTYSMDWEADHISLYVDGQLMYTQTDHIPQDAAHGGENESPGVGMQTSWSASLQNGHNWGTVYEVSYAKPVSDGGNASIPTTGGSVPQTGGDAAVPSQGTTTPTTHAPASLEAGSGADTLVLKLSEHFYAHDAQYTVTVDGQQVGGTFTVSALQGQGADTLTLHGDWGAGQHAVAVNFTNDAYDTNADWSKPVSADLNMFVEGATYNGQAVEGAALSLYNAQSANTFTATGNGDHAQDVVNTSTCDYIFA